MFRLFFCFMFSLLIMSNAYADNMVSLRVDDVKKAVLAEMIDQGNDENIDIEFFGGQTSFDIKNAQNVKILVSNLNLKQEQNKFFVDVEVFSDGKSFAKTSLLGKFYQMVDVYVPQQDIRKGEIIKDEMLKKISIRQGRAKIQMITSRDMLLNKQAKKHLKANNLIYNRDVGKEIILKKGDIITSVYKTKHMKITAKVEVAKDASIGEYVEVINVKSGKTLIAKVISASIVEVSGK